MSHVSVEIRGHAQRIADADPEQHHHPAYPHHIVVVGVAQCVGVLHKVELPAALLAQEYCHALLEYGGVGAIQEEKEITNTIVGRVVNLKVTIMISVLR